MFSAQASNPGELRFSLLAVIDDRVARIASLLPNAGSDERVQLQAQLEFEQDRLAEAKSKEETSPLLPLALQVFERLQSAQQHK